VDVKKEAVELIGADGVHFGCHFGRCTMLKETAAGRAAPGYEKDHRGDVQRVGDNGEYPFGEPLKVLGPQGRLDQIDQSYGSLDRRPRPGIGTQHNSTPLQFVSCNR